MTSLPLLLLVTSTVLYCIFTMTTLGWAQSTTPTGETCSAYNATGKRRYDHCCRDEDCQSSICTNHECTCKDLDRTCAHSFECCDRNLCTDVPSRQMKQCKIPSVPCRNVRDNCSEDSQCCHGLYCRTDADGVTKKCF